MAQASCSQSSSGQKLKLQDLVTSAETVVKRLDVMVGARGEWSPPASSQSQRLTLILVDSSGWSRAVLYDQMQDLKLSIGKCVTMKKFTFNGGVVNLSSKTSIFRIPDMGLPPDLLSNCAKRLLEPLHTPSTIDVVNKSPIKKKVSLRGTIVAVEGVKRVTINGVPDVPVRDVVVSDSTADTHLTLWRSAANAFQDMVPGTNVLVKSAIVSYNSFHKRQHIAINYSDELEIIQDDTPKTITLLALESVKPNESISFLASVNDTDIELKISFDDFASAVSDDVEITEDSILDLMPLSGKGKIQGNVLTEFVKNM